MTLSRLSLLRALTLGALLGLTAGCGAPPPSSPDAGAPDSGTPDAGDVPDAGPQGPTVSAQETRGAFLPNPVQTVLAGSSVVFFGTQAVPADPRWLGLPPGDGSKEAWVRTGLMALEPATGKVRIHTTADGLPSYHFSDVFEDYGEHTTSIADMAWLERDHAFAAAGWSTVIRGTADAQGGWHYASARLRRSDATVDAQVGSVAVAGGELFAGTDQGVVALEPATLTPRRWVDLGVSMAGPWTYGLSAGTLQGQAVVAAVIGAAAPTPYDSAPPPSHLLVARAGQEGAAQLFSFDTGVVPLSVLALEGQVLVGVKQADGRGALMALRDVGGTLQLVEAAGADLLGASFYGNVLPGKLLFDAARGRLLVGGRLTQSGGGGLVWLPMASPDGEVLGGAEGLVASNDPQEGLLPAQVDVLQLDAQGRLYVAGRQLCSEHKLRVSGLYRLETAEDGTVRFVRPFVSGVRDIAVDPVDGHTWLALRDGAPGMQCDNLQVMQSLCRLKADGSCEVYSPVVNVSSNTVLPALGVSSIAFGRASARELALATFESATFVQKGEGARDLQTQFDPGLSLDLTRAVWGEPGALWLGSQMEWNALPPPLEGEEPLDEELVNDRGPHGLGYLQLGAGGYPDVSLRYVRKLDDSNDPDMVAGLPSNTVWDVLPLPGPQKALVATGIEREGGTYDHWLGAPSPLKVRGGVALVEGSQVTAFTFQGQEGQLLGDVMRLVRRADGSVLALDAALGVLSVDVAAHTVSVWAPAAWTEPERALSLAVDASGRVAVGTSAGLYVYGTDAAVRRVLKDGSHGYVWSLRFMDDGVLAAGTDQGLVHVALEGAPLPASLGPSASLPRELWPLPAWCDGTEGCTCYGNDDCVRGYACGLGPHSADGVCTLADPCLVDPGARNCACDPAASVCSGNNACVCADPAGTDCSCQPDASACTSPNVCACTDDVDCPGGFYCNPEVSQCQELPACDADCSCATDTGCPTGRVCEWDMMGNPVCRTGGGIIGPPGGP